jgi:hypothetical protein
MRKIALLSASLGAMLACMLPTMPAHAQFWVASFGSGTTCSRASPCATFQAAHNAATAGADIACVDAADYGRVIITKSITIDCLDAGALIVSSALTAVTVNTAGLIVRLRGLEIRQATGGTFGVDFANGSALYIENCVIAGFGSASSGAAINFVPAVAGGSTASLYVADSAIENSGFATGGGGIIIQPSGSGAARAVIERVQLVDNTHGIVADGTGGTGSIIVQIRDTVAAGSAGNGIWAKTSAGRSATGMVVDRTSAIGNAGSGILAQGTGALVHLGSSTVAGNGAGLSAQSGGNIFTYQDNQASGNSSDGAATGVLAVK